MSKAEAKKKIESIIETFASLREDLIMLEFEAFDAYLAVKPYEGMDELTPAQKELQDWFIELGRQLKEAWTLLDTIDNNLSDMTCC